MRALIAELKRGATTFGLGSVAVIAGIEVTAFAEVAGIKVTVGAAIAPGLETVALVSTGGRDGTIGVIPPITVLIWLTEGMPVLLSPPSVFWTV